MLIDLNTVNYVGHGLIILRPYLLQKDFPVFSVESTTMFYIIGNFFFLIKFSFLSSSFVRHDMTLFPTIICTCILDPCSISSLTFLIQVVGVGKFHTLLQVTETVEYVNCIKENIPGKISSGYIFHPSPHIMLYICQDT